MLPKPSLSKSSSIFSRWLWRISSRTQSPITTHVTESRRVTYHCHKAPSATSVHVIVIPASNRVMDVADRLPKIRFCLEFLATPPICDQDPSVDRHLTVERFVEFLGLSFGHCTDTAESRTARTSSSVRGEPFCRSFASEQRHKRI